MQQAAGPGDALPRVQDARGQAVLAPLGPLGSRREGSVLHRPSLQGSAGLPQATEDRSLSSEGASVWGGGARGTFETTGLYVDNVSSAGKADINAKPSADRQPELAQPAAREQSSLPLSLQEVPRAGQGADHTAHVDAGGQLTQALLWPVA